MPENGFQLPIDLGNHRQLSVFMQAIDDIDFRRGLRETQLPAEPAQLLALADDARFIELSRDVTESYQRALAGEITVDEVAEVGRRAAEYLEESYPDALRALTRFAQEHRGPNFDSVAANTDVVANATVWANVSIATQVLAAAVAVVVVAIVVAAQERPHVLHPGLEIAIRNVEAGQNVLTQRLTDLEK